MTDDSPRRRCTLSIMGDFTDGELAAFVTLARYIDSSDPGRHFEVMIDCPTAKLAEMKPAMRDTIMPEMPGRTTPTISVHRKQ